MIGLVLLHPQLSSRLHVVHAGDAKPVREVILNRHIILKMGMLYVQTAVDACIPKIRLLPTTVLVDGECLVVSGQ